MPDEPERVPITTVGALNPDGTVALFSNDGPWVRFWRPGAALVSTFPTTYDGSREASNELFGDNGEIRAALDPDDYSAGFAVWSGTSFAAPLFAGQLADRLLTQLAEGPAQDDVVGWMRSTLDEMPMLGARP
jgi:subtilisin family serine protease